MLDYWILEELVLASCHVKHFYCNRLFADFCRNKNKNRSAVLADLLDHLVGGGLIEIIDDAGATSVNLRSIFPLTDEASSESAERQYCAILTSTGGATWESWAEPDWNRYIEDIWSDSFELKEGVTLELVEVTASSKSCIKAFSEAIRLMNRGEAFLGTSVDCESPWDATYWKTLSSGFKQRIVVVNLNEDSGDDSESNRDRYSTFRQWYKNGFNSFAMIKMQLDD